MSDNATDEMIGSLEGAGWRVGTPSAWLPTHRAAPPGRHPGQPQEDPSALPRRAAQRAPPEAEEARGRPGRAFGRRAGRLGRTARRDQQRDPGAERRERGDRVRGAGECDGGRWRECCGGSYEGSSGVTSISNRPDGPASGGSRLSASARRKGSGSNVNETVRARPSAIVRSTASS